MFGFNKKKHRSNIRIRREDDEDKAASPPKPTSVKPKKSSKSKKSDKSSKESSEAMPKLSFDDEIKAEVDFKVKKSSISRKLAREREREKSKKIKTNLNSDDFNDGEEFIVMDDMEMDESEETQRESHIKTASVIPDAHAIHKARKKREQARLQQDKDSSYIPVNSRQQNRDRVYKETTSRLVREGDGESDDERIDMKVHTEEDDIENLNLDEEKDEEFLAWEHEQMKKGASINTGTDVPVQNRSAFGEKKQQDKLSVNDYIPKFVMPDISIDSISNELHSELTSLKVLVSESEQDLLSTERALDTCETNIEKYEVKVADLSRAFEFYQETKCYINDYSKLLSLKIESIEQVEKDIYSLFGKKYLESRDFRRTQQQRLSVQVGVVKGQLEGRFHSEIPSTCPESDEEVEQGFVESYNQIVDKSETLMTDVRNEFSEITFVKQQFEKWKLQQGESYRNAYITQCLPLVFSPLIRLEMLGWNPLQPSCPNFEEYSWFISLMTYGVKEGHDPTVDDPDTNLIPIIVNKVLLPKITRLIESCWDPFSYQQTKRLEALLTLLFEDYIPQDGSKKTAEVDKMIKAIQHQIEQLIIHEAFLPFTADRSSNQDSKVERFLSFQYTKCIKILKNILVWDGVLESELVFKLSVDSLLNRHIVAFLQTSPNYIDTVDKIDMIIKTLPVAWFERSDKLLPELNSFATYLASLTQTIERKQSQCATDVDKKLHKTALRRVMSMLLRINGMDLVRRSR